MNKTKAIEILTKNQYKVTTRRETILDFFLKEDRYHTAKNLYDYMEERYPAISFDTVYRNLHLYHDLGILESTNLNAEKHFRISCHSDHHHHFICNTCGKTTPIHVCPMNEAQETLTSYKIEGHKFEIYGLCPECQIAS
ncbi:MAG TPA: Fur family transcriptional regulator [Pseudogracilibacillus sp.]|nr:Fur family transcriptional regulator [Pseudogracilibacillus sp.]